MLWAEAVRRAGSTEREAVIEALEEGLSIDAPSGRVTIDPKTHHAVLDIYLMEFQGQRLEVVGKHSQRQPVDTQQVCDLVANPDDNTQYEIKI